MISIQKIGANIDEIWFLFMILNINEGDSTAGLIILKFEGSWGHLFLFMHFNYFLLLVAVVIIISLLSQTTSI